jgi:heat-inducible transcriptional repressor
LGRQPHDAAALVERLELVYLAERRVLAVALLEDGAVRHRTVHLQAPVTPALVASAQALFAERFAGGPLETVRARLREELAAARESNRPSAPLLRLAASALPASTPPSDSMIIEGRRHLLTAGDVDRLLDTVEEKEMLLGLLEAFEAESSPRVILGVETTVDVLRGRALIAASYGPLGRPQGAVAVIGPLRMRYATVVPWVNFAARALSRLAESAA